MAGVGRDLGERDGGEDRYTDRDAVVAIDHVDSVRKEDDPEHRHDRRGDAETEFGAPGQPDLIDLVAGRVNGGGSGDLHRQLRLPCEQLQVIEKPDRKDERARAQKCQEVARLRREEFIGLAGDGGGDERRHREGDQDRRAAPARPFGHAARSLKQRGEARRARRGQQRDRRGHAECHRQRQRHQIDV